MRDKNLIRVLILEDDLEPLAILFRNFRALEKSLDAEISIMVVSEFNQAESLNESDLRFDVILLDRDCKVAGSFHDLDLEKFGIESIISISSMPQWNSDAQSRGVNRIVHKDYENLEHFGDQVISEVKRVLEAIL